MLKIYCGSSFPDLIYRDEVFRNTLLSSRLSPLGQSFRNLPTNFIFRGDVCRNPLTRCTGNFCVEILFYLLCTQLYCMKGVFLHEILIYCIKGQKSDLKTLFYPFYLNCAEQENFAKYPTVGVANRL